MSAKKTIKKIITQTKIYGLFVGVDDELTKKYRTADRCSVPDQTDGQTSTRKKRYALNGE